MASDILLGKSQAEASDGRLFGCPELLFMMGYDLYYVGLAHATRNCAQDYLCSKVIYHPAFILVQRNCVISLVPMPIVSS